MACPGGRATERSELAPAGSTQQERLRQLPSPFSTGSCSWEGACTAWTWLKRQQRGGVCDVHRASTIPTHSNWEFYLSVWTLLPCMVLFVNKFEYCNVCYSWCLCTWAGINARVNQGIILQQLLWMERQGKPRRRVSWTHGPRVAGGVVCPHWVVAHQDKTSFVSEKLFWNR